MTKILVLIQCHDRVGIVADISGVLAALGWNIVVMREFVDRENQQFFARVECERKGEDVDYKPVKSALEQKIARESLIRVSPLHRDKKVAVLVTKEYHCLGDVLVRHFFEMLGANVCCVIGNRQRLQPFVERFSVPFYHVPAEGRSRDEFEAELLERLDSFKPDFIILAKFMRILSANFIAHYPDKIINIHHSFLPAFIGANPYRQAYERGVKVIGATAHIVTEDLDNGPIIAQQTIAANHDYDAARMKVAGSEIERSVLSRAMELVLEDRVFVTGNKTVVFE